MRKVVFYTYVADIASALFESNIASALFESNVGFGNCDALDLWRYNFRG